MRGTQCECKVLLRVLPAHLGSQVAMTALSCCKLPGPVFQRCPGFLSWFPQVAQRFSVEVRQGDIIVAATDGLFDNVYPDEAASLVSASKVRAWGPPNLQLIVMAGVQHGRHGRPWQGAGSGEGAVVMVATRVVACGVCAHDPGKLKRIQTECCRHPATRVQKNPPALLSLERCLTGRPPRPAPPPPARLFQQERGENAQAAAVTLAQFARMRAADPTHLSPFAYGAQQLGYRYFGGKMDDITVLCAYVAEAPQPRSGSPSPPPPSARL